MSTSLPNPSDDDDMTVLSFFGFKHSKKAVERIYSLTVNWAEALEYPPTKLATATAQNSSGLRDFKRGAKKLSLEGFAGISSFEMHCLSADAHLPWRQSYLSADYEGARRGCFLYLTVREPIAQIRSPLMKLMALEIAEILSPSYGFGFTRSCRLGPGLFAVGIMAGDMVVPKDEAEYQLRLRDNRWGDMGMESKVYDRGVMRDVFPINYLNSEHLRKRVNGISLEKWIRQDAARGVLTPITNQLTEWSVNDQELASLNALLATEGVTYDWRRDV
jgi:hypothetical protein